MEHTYSQVIFPCLSDSVTSRELYILGNVPILELLLIGNACFIQKYQPRDPFAGCCTTYYFLY